jgi:hypothetical protein
MSKRLEQESSELDAFAVAAALVGFEHADGVDQGAAGEVGEPGGEGAWAPGLEAGEGDDRLGVGLLHDVVEGEEGLPLDGDGGVEGGTGVEAIAREQVGQGAGIPGDGAVQEFVVPGRHMAPSGRGSLSGMSAPRS